MKKSDMSCGFKDLFTFLLASSIMLCGISFAYGAVLYVPGKYVAIQQAIDAANSGDTIVVSTGTYQESVTMKDGLTIIGLGLPLIGSPSTGGLTAASDCTIEGFKIHTLLISGKNNVVVQDCTLLGKAGVLTSATVSNANGIVLSGNIFSDESYGGVTGNKVDISDVQNLTFTNNAVLIKNISDSSADITALRLNNVSNASITNNVIKSDSANRGIGVSIAGMAGASIRNNIIYGTTYSVDGNSANTVVSYNDLPEGIDRVGTAIALGPNNFSAEPVFAEGNGYYLKPSSPCIDAGIIMESDKTEMGAHQKITYIKETDSLQSAINNASSNEIIYLGPGTYAAESYTIQNTDGTADVTSCGILIIRKDVHIVGSGKYNTFVTGPVEFIFSDGSLENLSVKSPNLVDLDHIAEVDYDLDGRQDYALTGSILIANGSPKIDNVVIQPDFAVLGGPENPTGTGIAVIENTSGSPTSPIIKNTILKKFVDAIRIEGNHDEIVLSPVIEHNVFDQNTNGVTCATPYALLSIQKNIFTNMTSAVDIASTPYKDMIVDNTGGNLFYNNGVNFKYAGGVLDILANNRNNQSGDPKYLKPDVNLYATLFDSPAMAIGAGLEYYSEKESNVTKYYESSDKGYLLAEVIDPDQDGNFTQTVDKYDASGAYTGKTVQHFVGTMAELHHYEEFDAANVLTGVYYADGKPYPGGVPGEAAPVVALISPDGTSLLLKGVIPVTWTATDPNLDPLSISIYYSQNGGSSFTPLALGLENDGVYEWASAKLPDSDNYKIRVVAYKTNNNAITSQDESSDAFKVDNTLPSISITSPGDNTGVDVTSITVTGTVSDTNLEYVDVLVAGYSPDWIPAEVTGGNFSCSVDIPANGARAIIVAKAVDTAGNMSTDKVGIIKGYMRFIPLTKYYSRSENLFNLSSIAAAKDMLDLMRPDPDATFPSDADINNYGHTRNLPENAALAELDPNGLDDTLDHFDTYTQGYNYGIYSMANTNFNNYLKEIVHWMSWAVKKNWSTTPPGKPEDYPDYYTCTPYMPAVAPLYGNKEGYSRWVVINGCASDRSPLSIIRPWEPNVINVITVYGMFMTDPDTKGIGQDNYIASSSLNDFLRPMPTSAIPGKYIGDRYAGKYVMIAEPPEEELNAECKIAAPNVNKSTLNLINIAEYVNNANTGKFRKHLVDSVLVVDLNEADAAMNFSTNAKLKTLFKPTVDTESGSKVSWKDIIDPALLLNEDFRNAIQDTIAREFIKVHRLDIDEDYYIVPFDKFDSGQFVSYAATLLDANDGHFIQATFVKEPARYVQLTKEEAIAKIIESRPEIASKKIEARLVWEVGGMTLSPFYPYWEVTAGESKYYIFEK